MKISTLLFAALLLAAPLATMSAPRDVEACVNAQVDARDEADGKIHYASAIKRAEEAVQHGDNAKALSLVTQVYKELAKLDDRYKTPEKIKRSAESHKPELVPRAARIAALALVRTNGHLTLEARSKLSKSGSAKRLAWGVSVLTYLHEQAPDDAELRNYHAEALAAQPDKKADALAAFAALEKEQLLLTSSKNPLERLREGKPAFADPVAPPQAKGTPQSKGVSRSKGAAALD